jgi:hypothetical protein
MFKHGANQNHPNPENPMTRAKEALTGANNHEAETTLSHAVPAGVTVLAVANTAGFLRGREIWIAPGTPNQESNVVKAYGSLILRLPTHHPHAPGVEIVMPEVGKRLPPPPTTSTTTTTTTYHTLLERSSGSLHSSRSAGGPFAGSPLLPLACLFFVSLVLLCALLVAAYLDPCQPRKHKVHDASGSVASVGSVASAGSEDGYYYSTGYGDSVGVPGGSVYTSPSTAQGGSVYDYGYLPQDPQNYQYGFPISPFGGFGGPLATVTEWSEPAMSSNNTSRYNNSFA